MHLNPASIELFAGFFINPEGGDTDDPKTQNGYAYANNKPIMMTDPDGNYAWVVINAGFAAYDGYKAYKAGKASGKQGWGLAGSVALAAGSSFVKVGHLKKAGNLLNVAKGRTGKQARLRKIAEDNKLSSALRGEIKRDINQIKRKNIPSEPKVRYYTTAKLNN